MFKKQRTPRIKRGPIGTVWGIRVRVVLLLYGEGRSWLWSTGVRWLHVMFLVRGEGRAQGPTGACWPRGGPSCQPRMSRRILGSRGWFQAATDVQSDHCLHLPHMDGPSPPSERLEGLRVTQEPPAEGAEQGGPCPGEQRNPGDPVRTGVGPTPDSLTTGLPGGSQRGMQKKNQNNKDPQNQQNTKNTCQSRLK